METPARCCVREDVLLEHQNACCAMGCAKVDAGAFSAEEEAEDSSTFILYINLQFALFLGYHLFYITFRVHGRQIALPPQHMVHTLCARSDRGRLRIHATLFWKTQIANTSTIYVTARLPVCQLLYSLHSGLYMALLGPSFCLPQHPLLHVSCCALVHTRLARATVGGQLPL